MVLWSNFLQAAIRNLQKHRVPSILKSIRLAIGVSCSLYVYLYVHDELTYNTQHPDPHNTYRVVFQEKGSGDQPPANAWAPHGWGRYLQENIKGIKACSSINRAGGPFSFFTTEKMVISGSAFPGWKSDNEGLYRFVFSGIALRRL